VLKKKLREKIGRLILVMVYMHTHRVQKQTKTITEYWQKSKEIYCLMVK